MIPFGDKILELHVGNQLGTLLGYSINDNDRIETSTFLFPYLFNPLNGFPVCRSSGLTLIWSLRSVV